MVEDMFNIWAFFLQLKWPPVDQSAIFDKIAKIKRLYRHVLSLCQAPPTPFKVKSTQVRHFQLALFFISFDTPGNLNNNGGTRGIGTGLAQEQMAGNRAVVVGGRCQLNGCLTLKMVLESKQRRRNMRGYQKGVKAVPSHSIIKPVRGGYRERDCQGGGVRTSSRQGCHQRQVVFAPPWEATFPFLLWEEEGHVQRGSTEDLDTQRLAGPRFAMASETEPKRAAWVVGSRVVRGPDWQWAKQDGGKGRLGTVRAFERAGQVRVVWDNGNIANYRCADADDLQVFDSAPTGIAHDGVLCNSCRALPIVGIRWRCAECLNLDLCTACYHGDRHALRHRFYSIAQPSGRFVLQKSRSKSRKLVVRGVLPGARVMRGCDWQWNEQDGGQDKRGKVIETRDWCEAQPRSAVCVRWECGSENLYRMGFLGMVDVKCMHYGKGRTFYVDHCPVLAVLSGDQHPLGLQAGERVCVALELELVQMFQHGHGGWSDGMLETLDTTGTICEIDGDLDALVAYPSGNRWTLNPAVLIKVNIEDDENDSHGTSRFTRDCDHDSIDTITPKQQVSLLFVLDLKPPVLLNGNQGHSYFPVKGTQYSAYTSTRLNSLHFIFTKIETILPCCTPNLSTKFRLKPSIIFELRQVSKRGRRYTIISTLFTGSEMSKREEDLLDAVLLGDTVKTEELLMQDGVHPRRLALQVACESGQVEVLQLLLRHGADPEAQDNDGNRAIHHAMASPCAPVVVALCLAGADINVRNQHRKTPLHQAIRRANMEVARTLLQNGAHPSLQDCEGDSPLHEAVSSGVPEAMQLLLAVGADVCLTNDNGFNALHYATLLGNTTAVELLLSLSSVLGLTDLRKADGYAALHLAALNNRIEAAKVLMEQGKASVNLQNSKQQTPLHLAVMRRHVQLVQLLLEGGAQTNLQDHDGDTALHEAMRPGRDLASPTIGLYANQVSFGSCEGGQLEITEMLLGHGVDASFRNKHGQTAADLCSDPALVQVLSTSLQELHSTLPVSGLPVAADGQLQECLVCSSGRPDTIFVPCGHAVACKDCATRIRHCLLCRKPVQERNQLYECVICAEGLATVVFEPCGHACVCIKCALRARRCLECRQAVESTNSLVTQHPGGTPDRVVYPSGQLSAPTSPAIRTPTNQPREGMGDLERQLQQIKDQTMCPVCLDRTKNMVFMCGHSTCQRCSDRVTECPICRKRIRGRVLLY
uniref:E3 ubiquitin-protein ligase MIB1-like n=1 Tax=Myxine glutinosa TaxID=7769 RepID=UPI0035901ADB